MRILRWLVVFALCAIGAVIALTIVARFADGPIGPFAGGGFRSGELVSGPEPDWSFAATIPEVELQLVEPPPVSYALDRRSRRADLRSLWVPQRPFLEAMAPRGHRGREGDPAHRWKASRAAGGQSHRPCPLSAAVCARGGEVRPWEGPSAGPGLGVGLPVGASLGISTSSVLRAA